MKKIPKSHPRHWHMLKMRERLMKAYPNCFMPFGEIKKPLKIGIHRDLADADFTTSAYEWRDVLCALADYVHGKGYYKAIVPGAIRVGLDGEPAGTVSDGAAADAARKLAKIERREAAVEAAKQREIEAKAKAEAEAKAKAEAEAAAKRKAEIKARQRRPAERQHRKVQVEIVRRRPGVPGVTRRFG